MIWLCGQVVVPRCGARCGVRRRFLGECSSRWRGSTGTRRLYSQLLRLGDDFSLPGAATLSPPASGAPYRQGGARGGRKLRAGRCWELPEVAAGVPDALVVDVWGKGLMTNEFCPRRPGSRPRARMGRAAVPREPAFRLSDRRREDARSYPRPCARTCAGRQARFDLPERRGDRSGEGARLLVRCLAPVAPARRRAVPVGRAWLRARAYQLVPLLMALRLPVVRPADRRRRRHRQDHRGRPDPARTDRSRRGRARSRSSARRISSTVGPATEVEVRSRAVAVTASSAARLERACRVRQSLFDAHPYTVVSLDYIKADIRRDEFVRACPEFVIVDEAHACVGTPRTASALRAAGADLGRPPRHLVLLTATPHSGDRGASIACSACSRPSTSARRTGAATRGLPGSARAALRAATAHRHQTRLGGRAALPDATREERPTTCRRAPGVPDAVLDYCPGVVERAGSDKATPAARVLGNARADALRRLIPAAAPEGTGTACQRTPRSTRSALRRGRTRGRPRRRAGRPASRTAISLALHRRWPRRLVDAKRDPKLERRCTPAEACS